MATITEDYISFEAAKLLKEKGFPQGTFRCHYIIDGNVHYKSFENRCGFGDYDIIAPTLQMTMKWLREIHHYYIQVMLDGWACGGHLGYYVVIQKTDSEFEMMLQDVREQVFYDTPEEAAEDAIMYIVENLI
jgi:hypothetical protein